MLKRSALICAGLLIGMTSTTIVAGDIEAGKAKSLVCSACHGQAGISAVDLYPNLAGQKKGYLIKQIKAFKAKERIDATMAPMVAALTDEDIENLAEYYSSLK